MAVEWLGWPIIPGSPTDLAQAKINYSLAHLNWASSMTSEIFDGVVTFSTEDYLAAQDEYSAARKRYHERLNRLATL